jgi:hypothetical protein
LGEGDTKREESFDETSFSNVISLPKLESLPDELKITNPILNFESETEIFYTSAQTDPKLWQRPTDPINFYFPEIAVSADDSDKLKLIAVAECFVRFEFSLNEPAALTTPPTALSLVSSTLNLERNARPTPLLYTSRTLLPNFLSETTRLPSRFITAVTTLQFDLKFPAPVTKRSLVKSAFSFFVPRAHGINQKNLLRRFNA